MTVLLLALACKDSTGPSGPDIVGTWNATKIEFVREVNPATKVDIIAAGATGVFVFNANKTFAFTLGLSSGNSLSTGSWDETRTTLTIAVTNQVPTEVLSFGLALSGITLTLTGGTTTYDFGGGEEQALMNIVLVKQ